MHHTAICIETHDLRYLEVSGSKHIGHSPSFAAVCSPSIGHGVEETQSEDQLLPSPNVPVVEVLSADGSRSLGGEDLVHVGLHCRGSLKTNLYTEKVYSLHRTVGISEAGH